MMGTLKSLGPINWKALMPATAGTISIFLSLHVTLTCQYATLIAPNGFAQNRGIWYLEGFERIGDSDDFRHVCTPYPVVVQMDPTWQATRLFTLACGIIGSAITSFLWSCMFSPLSRKHWFYLAGACVGSAILQTFTFMYLNSSACKGSEWVKQSSLRSCNASVGFDTNIAATMFWLLTAVLMIAYPPHLFTSKEKTEAEPESGAAPDLSLRDDFPVKEFSVRKMASGRSMSASEDGTQEPGEGDSSEIPVGDEEKVEEKKEKKDDDSSVDLLEREDLPEIC